MAELRSLVIVLGNQLGWEAAAFDGFGAVPIVRKLLARVGLVVGDIDYFEVNEAFAVLNLRAENELEFPRGHGDL